MNLHSRNGVLFEAHGWNKKAVDHVLRPQMQLYRATDRNNHRGRKNIVASRGIVWINAQRIAFIWPGKLLCVCSAKNSVSSGIAEIPLELRPGDFNFNLTSLLLSRHYA